MSKRIRKPIETDDGKEFVNKIFFEIPKLNDNKRYSRYASKGTAITRRFTKTIRSLLHKINSLERDPFRIIEIPSVFKNYNNTKQHSFKMTTVQTSDRV